jgi:hypothetical protein
LNYLHSDLHAPALGSLLLLVVLVILITMFMVCYPKPNPNLSILATELCPVFAAAAYDSLSPRRLEYSSGLKHVSLFMWLDVLADIQIH